MATTVTEIALVFLPADYKPHVVSAARVCRGVVVSDIHFGFVRSTGPFLTMVPYEYALQKNC